MADDIETMETPEWVGRLWPQIIERSKEIFDWAGEYSNGYISDNDADGERGLPDAPPASLKLRHNDCFEHDQTYNACLRDEMNGYVFVPAILELNFESFNMFRLHNNVLDVVNDGYEDQAGTENERYVCDGDHTVVIYML
jgi:hypothetical protein